MDQTLLAYFAGLFDGEGSVGISKQPRGNSELPSYVMFASIQMTDPMMLNEGHLIWGGARTTAKRNPQRPNDKTVHVWRMSPLQAQKFLIDILPYLKLKRDRAVVALEFQNHMTESGKRRFAPGKGFKKSDAALEISIREPYYLRLRELNHRGL